MPSSRSLVAFAALACLLVVAPAPAADRPQTIPALQSWQAGEGTWRPGARPRIAFPCGNPGLRAEARLLARDLETLTGRPAAAGRCGVAPGRGDLALARARRAGSLGAEGYRLRIGRAFTIAARRGAGAFYGGRTLLQLVARRRPDRRAAGRATGRATPSAG